MRVLNTRKSAVVTSLTLGLTLAVLSLSSVAQPIMNGVASFERLGKERFVAALYTDNPTSDASILFLGGIHRSMEIRTPSRFSARQHIRTWVESAAVNSSTETLRNYAQAMTQFTQLINFTMRPGDTLVIDAPADSPLSVSLNGTELGTIDEPGLFDVLLRTWVGRVPLSSAFREQLLVAGDIPADILARFGGLTPSQERIEFAQARIAPPVPEPEPEPEPPAQQVVVEPVAQPIEVAVTPPAEIAQEPASEPEPQLAENVEPPQAEPEVAAAAPAQASPATESAPEPEPETVDIALATPSSPPEEEFEEEEEEEFLPFSVDSLLEQQLYHSSLFAHTFKNVRYPSRAQRLSREGRVIVQVLVAPDGALVASELAETSGYKSLDKAALSAVKDSDPFPAPPAGLATVDEPFEFILPIEFKLQN